MKKIKKIVLYVIVSIIALVSVFSCFKGKYTPEPILTPVNVLKPVKSENNNIINPVGTYDRFYINTSLSYNEVVEIIEDISFTINEDAPPVYQLFYKFVSNEYTLSFSFGDVAAYVQSPTPAYMFTCVVGETETILWISNEAASAFGVSGGWQKFSNPILFDSLTGESSSVDMDNVGNQNEKIKDIISPTPFLFEGTNSSIAWTSSGLDNPNNIQNIYFNTNLTNQAIKNILDTYVGDTSGKDIFYYLDAGVRVRCHIINNSANAFIQIIGGSTTLYKWIYDSIDTDETIWWYGIDPQIINNNNVIVAPHGIALEGFNIYELRCLFSSANDFTETPSGDSYEQGYRDGYTAGETAGYNQGYLDGLDDGAGSNVNFQYIESVLTLIGNFLNIEILPNIKLSYALGIVIILSIISIIKMVVK